MIYNKKLEQANRLLIEGYWYNSCVYFSQLVNENITLFNKQVSEIYSEKEILIIIDEAKNDYNKFKHIMSIGDTWNDDEMLLLMSIRVELELVSKYFKFSQLEFPRLDILSLDEDLEFLRDSKLNSNNYCRALSFMYKTGPSITKQILH